MDINFAKMAMELVKYDKVVFYGAGAIAQMLYTEMKQRGVKIALCVVTQKANDDLFFNEIPIYQLNSCISILREKGTIILIAVNYKFVQEIERALCDLKISNYLVYSIFFKREKLSLFERYKEKTIEDCIEEILEWYMENEGEDYKNINTIKMKLEEDIYYGGKIKNKIIVAIGDLSPRVIKIIKALYNAGKEIRIFIYPFAILREVCKRELNELDIQYHECSCIEEFIYKIIQEHSEVIHVFSCSTNTVIPYILIKMKGILSNIVYDEYDIINKFYYNYHNDRLEEERYCLEHADGICNRGYELDYLERECGYRFQGKRIHFMDYCRDADPIKKENDSLEELSICYAGGVITEKEYPDASMACWLELAQKCAEEKCHLHVYPTEWREERYADYIELEKRNKYFHFHHPVRSEILKQELSRYDYGIHPIKSGFLQNEINGYYKKEKMIYGVTNHFFDNLDAGIPTIAAMPVLFAKYFEEKGVLIPWTIEEYDYEILRKKKSIYKRQAVKVQKQLQIKNHIHELMEFYSKL